MSKKSVEIVSQPSIEMRVRRNSTVYTDEGLDHTPEWEILLQGPETNFPLEASFANHFFFWKHILMGDVRNQFDCTDPKSFRLIPPQDYLRAFRAAKRRGEI